MFGSSNQKLKNDELVYRTPVTVRDIKSTAFNLLFYTGMFFLWMYLTKAYYNFGKYIITTGVVAMIVFSAVVAMILPSQRLETIKGMKKGVGIYLATLFGYRYVIMAIGGVSSEGLAAAFNQALPSTSGTAMLGWMQNILWIVSIMTPIGFAGMQLKKIAQFIGAKRKDKAIKEIRDIRN